MFVDFCFSSMATRKSILHGLLSSMLSVTDDLQNDVQIIEMRYLYIFIFFQHFRWKRIAFDGIRHKK